MNRRPLAVPLLLCAALLSGGPLAAAQGKDDPAWAYFNAGQQAYAAGKYAHAIQAFEKAYEISPKPGLIFSIAQAYRKQYDKGKSPDALRKAVEHYRRYLELVPEGGRRADAQEALTALEPALAKVAQQGGAAPAEEAAPATRLVVTSVKGAKVAVDGGAPVAMPLMADVKPGPHTLQITADGYFPEERQVVAIEGDVVALDVSLRERPAELLVSSISGAEVTIDRRPIGAIPMGRPVELAPGGHFVAVTLNGYKPYGKDVTLARGEKREHVVPLERTNQRVLSYVLMGVGVVGAGLGAVAVGRAAEAPPDSAQRQQQRNFAALAFSGAVLSSGVGLFLYFFDAPDVPQPPPRPDPAPAGPASPEPAKGKQMSLRAAPVLGPGIYGATLGGRF